MSTRLIPPKRLKYLKTGEIFLWNPYYAQMAGMVEVKEEAPRPSPVRKKRKRATAAKKPAPVFENLFPLRKKVSANDAG
jgi:hypothetical protein